MSLYPSLPFGGKDPRTDDYNRETATERDRLVNSYSLTFASLAEFNERWAGTVKSDATTALVTQLTFDLTMLDHALLASKTRPTITDMRLQLKVALSTTLSRLQKLIAEDQLHYKTSTVVDKNTEDYAKKCIKALKLMAVPLKIPGWTR